MRVRTFKPQDSDAVIELWRRCGLTRPWNDPRRDIERKLAVQPELFLVGELDGSIVASAMAGYDGHRGWVNYLAVDPGRRHAGLGRALVAAVETRLRALGCAKINVQIRRDNTAAIDFYRRLGFVEDEVVSLGLRLVHDDDSA